MKNKILSMLLSVTMLSSMVAMSVNADETATVNDVYNITFNNCTDLTTTSAPTHELMAEWVKGDGLTYNKAFSLNGTKSGLAKSPSWGVQVDPAPAADETDDKALKVLSSPSSNQDQYMQINTLNLNSSYTDKKNILCGENGYTEISFDFYSDFLTNMDLRVGRYYDQNGDVIDYQKLLKIDTSGNIELYSTTVKTLDTQKYKNKWHNIKFVFKANGQYRAFLDNEPLIGWTALGGNAANKSIGGIRELRLYNDFIEGKTSTKYYDNLRYSFSNSPYPEAKFTTSVSDAIVSGENVTDASEATGFVATVTNSGNTAGTFDTVKWTVTSGNDKGGIKVSSNTTLEAGASVIYGLIVNGLKDADAQASVTVE